MSRRLQLVVEHVDVRPTDHVVEVGCGHGVAATFVLERLTTGRYTGVDRSAPMIAAAERRNRTAVDARTARFVLGSFAAADLPVDDVDRLFAARVAAMVRADELTAGWRLLRPGGVLVLSFDVPADAGLSVILDHAVAAVTAAGFVGVRRIAARADGGALVSVSGVRP